MKKIFNIIALFIVLNFTLINICTATYTIPSLKTDMQKHYAETDVKTDISKTENFVRYSTGGYSIKLPANYNRKNDNLFFKDSEDELNRFFIKYETYTSNNITEKDIYNDEFLSSFKLNFEKTIKEYIASEITNISDIDENTLNTISQNITYNIAESNICNVTKNNYKAFHFLANITVPNILDLCYEQYLVYTSNYVTTFGFCTTNRNYLESDELYSIINNIKINDTILPKEVKETNYLEEETLNLLINFILTIVMYCFVPMLIKLIHGAYDNKEAKKISLTNSIIVACICILIKSAQGIASTSGVAFVYYYINKWILTKKKIENKRNSNSESTSNNNVTWQEFIEKHSINKGTKTTLEQATFNNNISENQKDEILKNVNKLQNNNKETQIKTTKENIQRFCVNCGKQLQDDWKFCNYCGHKLK